MSPNRPGGRRSRWTALLALLTSWCVLAPAGTAAAATQDYTRISGSGSTWSQNALDQWRRNVQQYGMTVDYAGVGSSQGRQQFLNGSVDFAVSEIPFVTQPEFPGEAVERPERGTYAYMPIVAGGTAFMYNLKIGGQQVTNLRLSGEVLAKIFTGAITTWADPAIQEDNPGLRMPNRRIVPVYRSEGSGTTAQFTKWMASEHPDVWGDFCERLGRDNCGFTSYYPQVPGGVGQNGSTGVAGYVRQAHSEGAITYVEYSYAVNAGFPVAKVLNRAGYYVEPTAQSVAVGLLQAEVEENPNSPDYLTQQLEGVYRDDDPRTYPLSSYSYMILPTTVRGIFTEEKGYTLSSFANWFLCQGQQQAEELGYSPLPINLVEAAMEQVRRIPGAVQEDINIRNCNNPTFSPDGTNTLARNAPQPAACDRQGPQQCTDGTGGNRTPTRPSGNASGSGGGGGSNGSGSGGGAGDTGSGTTGGSGAATGGNGGSGTTGGSADSGGSADGGSSEGGDGGGSATTGGPTDQASGPVYDPDTGSYVDDSAGVTGGAGTGQIVLATPTSLETAGGWSTRHTLMVLAAALMLAVIVAPPAVSRWLARRGGRA
ncbi:phosphate ABC transporter substrate-binding protein PstS [Allostreptomyces psammosilenae]|uniref:Phosphate ABC transporter phosphate-binding protein n=1 Tax=Allostreptomyces psammosilenae TaxID=1892865 RepID=A0A853A6H9_9ACTN|nr:phosphate ABC transporter substrate-binding protein PstS [Allostreptomyces psammosilenae]NYI06281.1 phosphate ABC transporter phosphate-binding protein [Allostreptomyces psammosilenae]